MKYRESETVRQRVEEERESELWPMEERERKSKT